MSMLLRTRILSTAGRRLFAESSIKTIEKEASKTLESAVPPKQPNVVTKTVKKVVIKTPLHRKFNWFTLGFLLTGACCYYGINQQFEKKKNDIQMTINNTRVELQERTNDFEQRILRLENASKRD